MAKIERSFRLRILRHALARLRALPCAFAAFGCASGSHGGASDRAIDPSAMTLVRSGAPAARRAPIICFIPGGPGLSSATLRSMELLSRSFDLAFVDPPGTGQSPGSPEVDFDRTVQSLAETLAQLDRPVVLAGHSYGGVYAGALALLNKQSLKIVGAVFIDAPLGAEAWKAAGQRYQTFAGPTYRLALDAYRERPSEKTFQDQMIAASGMFFRPGNIELGRDMIARDRMNWRLARATQSDPTDSTSFMARLKALSIQKVSIAGSRDRILPTEVLHAQSNEIGSAFFAIEAGHFPTFDDPERVAQIFEAQFRPPP